MHLITVQHIDTYLSIKVMSACVKLESLTYKALLKAARETLDIHGFRLIHEKDVAIIFIQKLDDSTKEVPKDLKSRIISIRNDVHNFHVLKDEFKAIDGMYIPSALSGLNQLLEEL